MSVYLIQCAVASVNHVAVAVVNKVCVILLWIYLEIEFTFLYITCSVSSLYNSLIR